jgi:thioredoxin 1
MKEIIIDKNNFEAEVINSEKPVLIDFWATWCAPCMMTSPELSKFAEAHPEIKVGKVNVDEQAELSTLFKINSIPAFFLIENGKVTKKAVGAMTVSDFEKTFIK